VDTKLVEVTITEEIMDMEVALDRSHFKSTAPCLPCLLREVQLATEIPSAKRVETVEIRATAEPLFLLPKAHTPAAPQAHLTRKVPMVLQVVPQETPVTPKKEEPVPTVALLVDQAAQATVEAPVEPQALVDTQVVAPELEEAVGLEAIQEVAVDLVQTKDLLQAVDLEPTRVGAVDLEEATLQEAVDQEDTLQEVVDQEDTLVETVDLEATPQEAVDLEGILVVAVDMEDTLEEATDL
jgi:hypothetical protein